MISLFERKKTELTMLVAIIILMAISPTMASAAPSDISDHWAETYIDEWLDKGLITGYPDGTFKPDNKITRAEFMVLVNGAFGYTDKVTVDYTDVAATDWYADTVAKAGAAGYITGYTDGTIKPNKQISRQEAAVIIMKVNNLAQTETVADKFTDSSNIPSWSKGAIGATIASGIMGGYPDGSFKAANPITRAEAVVALSKALNAKAKIPVIPDISNGSETYDLAGTYGPAIGSRTVQGDVTIKVPGVTLQNIVIEGNLIIGKEVADGKATFKNIIVKGNTYIYGGGVNSIYFIDSQTGKTYVIKDDGPVRIVVAGTTEISQLIAQSSLTVAEVDLTGEGVEKIIVNRQVDGQIEINLSNATVDNLEINSPGVTIITNSNTTIGTLVTEASVKVTGKGTIENAVINANGVTFETKPESQTIASGISSPTITTGISSSDGSSGGSTGSPPRVQPAISPSVYLLNKNIISDIPVIITWGSARKITGISGSALGGALKLYPKENIDYIVKDNTDGTGLLTIKSDKLSQLLPIPITAVPDKTSLTLIIKFDYGEKSLDIIVVSDTSQPFISPTQFDFNKDAPADIPINIIWGNATKITQINGSAMAGALKLALEEGRDYLVRDNGDGTGLLTIKQKITNLLPIPIYAVPEGTVLTLDIEFDLGKKSLDIMTVSNNSKVKATSIAIVGNAVVGSVLTAVPTPSNAKLRYQWMRAEDISSFGEYIAGANTNTYTLVTDDIGKYIKVRGETISSYPEPIFSQVTQAVSPLGATKTNCRVYVNNIEVKSDVGFYMYNEVLLVPMRAVAESMGLTATWDAETQQISFALNTDTLVMTNGSTAFSFNRINRTMPVPPTIIDNRLLVPIRPVVEAFGGTLGVDIGASSLKINPIDSNDEIITGIVDGTGFTITVRVEDTIIGSGLSQENGLFSIAIAPQASGTTVDVIASDGTNSNVLRVVVKPAPLEATKTNCRVYVNDIEVKSDVGFYIYDEVLLVPVRAVAESMGLTATWDAETQQISFALNTDTLVMTNGSTEFSFNGINHTMSVPPMIIDGRSLVPIRVVVEAFGGTLRVDTGV